MRVGTGKPLNKNGRKHFNRIERQKQARERAAKMRANPSWLEKIMMSFLDDRGVRYEFQKILYIMSDKNNVSRYYIVDFYIPDKNLIVEVDGKFHDDQIEKDDKRTMDIKRHYSGIELVRVTYGDFKSPKMLDRLSMYVMSDKAYREMFGNNKK